jgi:hypothetical protein
VRGFELIDRVAEQGGLLEAAFPLKEKAGDEGEGLAFRVLIHTCKSKPFGHYSHFCLIKFTFHKDST